MEFNSARLSLQQIQSDDWQLFHALHTEPDVIAMCFDEPSENELKTRFESRLEAWSPKSTHWLCLVMTELETGQRVGVTGYCVQEDGVAEVGFMLLPEFQGKGFATESLKALIEHSQLNCGFHTFNAVVTEGNFASERVLVKSGFVRVEVVPEAYEIGGKRYADLIYRLEYDGE